MECNRLLNYLTCTATPPKECQYLHTSVLARASETSPTTGLSLSSFLSPSLFTHKQNIRTHNQPLIPHAMDWMVILAFTSDHGVFRLLMSRAMAGVVTCVLPYIPYCSMYNWPPSPSIPRELG
ncbi:hypothetical protein B0A50_04837 [Salinomyces thailandicus]|uniref:Uncharacterized protein n=1 Tax=Salinomyces thailandicus TaxID=706561 RepID=A0A4U0U093_9PEZI|nr:hypothetical protein B0A50_04837 [Salinomyces thailandica]